MDKKSFDKQLKADSVENKFKIENNYIVFDNSANLSYKVLPNFTLSELLTKNPVSSYTKLNKDLLLRLNAVRQKLNKPIKINSGYRSPEYNKTVPNSASNSLHTKGDALDLGVEDTQVLSDVVKSFGWSGELGIYNTFCHIGIGSTGTWDKRSKEVLAKVKEFVTNDSNRNMGMVILPIALLFFLIKILKR